MTSCFSLPWFLVVVFAIVSILIAIMWFCEHAEKEYLKNREYQEIDDRIFLNEYILSGWWKNPEYERCYHLSIDYPGGMIFKKTEWLLNALFGSNRKLMWCEPPYSEHGKKLGVYHYRLFCDEEWKPIMPRGEVYSTQFTERGWKSFSELHKL